MFFLTLCGLLALITASIFFFLVCKNQKSNEKAGSRGALHDRASVRVAWDASKFWLKLFTIIFAFIYISAGIP